MAQEERVFPENPAHGDQVRFNDLNSTYFYDRPRKSWIFLTRPLEEGDFSKVTFGENPHSLPDIGDLWINLDYYMHTFNGSEWVGVTNDGEFGKVKISPVEPGEGAAGMMWYDSNQSDLKILYPNADDTPGLQWVSITALNGGVNITSEEMVLALQNLQQQLGQVRTDVEEVRSISVNTDGLLELD